MQKGAWVFIWPAFVWGVVKRPYLTWFGERLGSRHLELLEEGILSEGNTASKGMGAAKCNACSSKCRKTHRAGKWWAEGTSVQDLTCSPCNLSWVFGLCLNKHLCWWLTQEPHFNHLHIVFMYFWLQRGHLREGSPLAFFKRIMVQSIRCDHDHSQKSPSSKLSGMLSLRYYYIYHSGALLWPHFWYRDLKTQN